MSNEDSAEHELSGEINTGSSCTRSSASRSKPTHPPSVKAGSSEWLWLPESTGLGHHPLSGAASLRVDVACETITCTVGVALQLHSPSVYVTISPLS